jgi:signal transduction histidine kinase
MRAVSSLTNRIFLACTVVAALSLGLAFAFVNARASREAEEELRRGLDEAGRLVDEHRATLTDTFTRLARLIADLPKLKAAVETGDPPTVQPLADEYASQMKADVLVLTSPRGQQLAATGEQVDNLAEVIAHAGPTDEVSTFLPHGRGLLQIVSVPLLIEGELPAVLGRLTAGFFLDEALAARFKGLTASEIAFGADGRIVASTLPPVRRAEAAAALDATTIRPLTLGGEDFLVLARPLISGEDTASGAPAAVILRSRTERLRFLTTIRNGLMAALVVTLLVATLVSYGVARTMTRPLAAITTAMRETATTGDLTRKVSLKSRPWDDEDARLLASTFNTMTESIDRFQKDAAQKERLSALGRLSTVIAHEIRNPLMIIKSCLPSLQRDTVSASDWREAVADIEEETSRLNRVVTEVLDFARPIRFELAEADVNDVCRASAAAAWAGTTSVGIALDLDAAIPPLLTDAERLRTALVNLLANARHAVEAVALARTGTEGPAFRLQADDPGVTLRTRRDGASVIISIKDRGIGIAPDDMAHIFDPYFTTRRAGTGLGLPIAKNIVEALGGSLTAASRPGQGTEMRILLPLPVAEARA